MITHEPGRCFSCKRRDHECVCPPPPQSQAAAPDPYQALHDILDAAVQQASSGKGKERHASGNAFTDQPIVTIGEQLGSNHFEIGQAIKKARESTRLPPDRAEAELLGAINYLAAAVIVLRRQTGIARMERKA